VIGITGPWGSGKSSILNLLRENLKATYPDAIVVSFDPWLISGRNDLISEFIKELLATIEAEPKFVEKLKGLTDTITKYGERLAPAANFIIPGAGTLVESGIRVLAAARSHDVSLNDLRKKLLSELAAVAVPIVVLVDELDRIEDHEIRAVAQLVRSVADFPSISYVLAYDQDRVVQALGEGSPDGVRAERGRAYLEKIVQLQIPLPVTFPDEIIRLLSAELSSLQPELRFPEDFQNIERYKDLIDIFTTHLIQTPRDIKRLVGTFHVFASMLNQEVDWIDLLAYSALLIKAPSTVDEIRKNPGHFSEEALSITALAARLDRTNTSLPDRLSKLVPKAENNEGTQ
jgi:predicted KAP-like P-loop ATPase